jgi:glycosyltransferase involved in cell wall biosynthesis
MHADWLSLLDHRVLAPRLEQTDAILGCSRHITELTQAAFPALAGRCVTVHNGVDLERFRPPERRPHGALRLLTVGRIAPEKGIHVLLDALPRIHEIDPSVELHLIGPEAPVSVEMLVALSDDPLVTALGRFHPGPYLAPLLDRLPPRSRDRVRVVGKLSHVQTAPQYTRASILVAPSLWEPFGMPIVEGMAAGLPVVASRIDGIPEIVEPDHTGFLVPPGDSGALADALLALVADEGLRERFGHAGRARVERLFSWGRIADAAAAVYEGSAR